MKATSHPMLVMFTALLLALMLAMAALQQASAQTATPTATATNTPTATPNPATISNNMISCWTFNEISSCEHSQTCSSIRYDAYGPNHFTDNNTVHHVGYAIQGMGAYFNRANTEYLSIPDNTQLSLSGTQAFTLIVWAYLESLPPDNSFLVSKHTKSGSVAQTGNEYALYIASNGGVKWHFNDASGNQYGIVGTPVVPAQTPLYIAIRYDPAAASGFKYSTFYNGSWYYAGTTNTSIADSTGTFCVGQRCTISGQSDGLNGWVDNSQFFKRALTNAEVEWIYNSGYGRSCAEIIGARGTPTPTQTTAPTATANPAQATQALSNGTLIVNRSISYGDVSMVVAIGLLSVLSVAYMILRLTNR